MSKIDDLKDLPDISFIDDISLEDVLSMMKDWYESKYKDTTGEDLTLSDADPEMLKLGACALLIYQCMQYVDYTGKMNLLKYSEGYFLDNIAAGMHIKRKPGEAATVTMRFYLSAIQEQPVVIPEGTRCVVDDLFFQTQQTEEIPAGSQYTDIICECTEIGTDGNGYKPGEITDLVDTIYLVSNVENTTESVGGTDEETDDELAERYYLSFLSFAPWGGEPYYANLLRTWRSDIGDVICQSPQPCYTDIYFLMEDASIPSDDTVTQAQAYLNEKTRRELCDKLTVKKPDAVSFDITFTYYIGESNRGNADLIQQNVAAAVTEYKGWQCGKLGRDINPSMLFYDLMKTGVKRIDISKPVFATVSEVQIASVKNVEVVYGGIEDD